VTEPPLGESVATDVRSRRRELADRLDSWVAGLVDLGPGIALAAVGGLGRHEPAPRSDLDLVLIHAPGVALGDLPERIWYPIWDAGYRLDHSVRTPAEARRLAGSDIRVLLGLLDLRPLAGDVELVSSLRSSVLSDWRGLAGKRVGELRAAAAERASRFGSVAHLLEPDLKESSGGLRDITVLRAIAAASLTDVPHGQIGGARDLLLDVRDSIHDVGTNGNKLLAQDREAVAERLGVVSGDDLLRSVAAAGRSVEVAADEVWHRVTRLTNKPRWRTVRRGNERTPLAAGVVVQADEVVLALDGHPDADGLLVLRAAAAAAQSGRRLSPHTVGRLAAESAPLPLPWPAGALDEFVALLGSGAGLLPVWEALDQAGIIAGLIPAWAVVRSQPQHSPVHRFALDRHLVETAVQAQGATRDVRRPDLLLLAALLHDIGKGRGGDHSEVGAELAGTMLDRLGLSRTDRDVVVTLVRHHLLLPDTATRRDLDDPASVAAVTEAVGDHDTLDLLHALTIADAAATGPGAWSDWKAGLIADLVARTHGSLAGREPPDQPRLELSAAGSGVDVKIEPADAGWRITVMADDRVGLLAAVAGVMARHRLGVRAATTETIGARAVTLWSVHPLFGDPPSVDRLRSDLRNALGGAASEPVPMAERRVAVIPPRVSVAAEASQRATVLEVRAHDERGLLHRIATALSATGVDVIAARVSTFGAEAVDVFYVVDGTGSPLSPAVAEAVCARVLADLTQ
jgi:[protein-PII] uridylyltransferase